MTSLATQLAAEETRFIGRRADLARLAALVEQGERLISVMGPAGMGKTRLLRRYGSDQVSADNGPFEHVWFCELAEVDSVEGICSAVADACGLTLAANRDDGTQVSMLGEALAVLGRVLILLDNFEQLAPLSAGTVARWHQMAPEVVFIVSTRDRLHVPAEVIHELEPLSMDFAVELLRERAAAVRRGADTMPEATAAAIVERLDRMPLAIELAAARLGLLQPGQLLERLDRRFDLLKTKHRTRSARQATLWGAIDGSWQALDPEEQRALAAMSVFHGGFSLEAAESVLGHLGVDVLEVVQTLRDRSLLHVYVPPETPGLARLGLYETIRAFCVEQLAATPDALTAASTAHRQWALDVGGALSDQVHGHGGEDARSTLWLERDNLLAAFDAAVAAGQSEEAARLVLALDPVLSTRGPFARHRKMLDAVLEGSLAGADLRAKALLARGQHHRRSGLLAEARRDLEEALACVVGAEDTALEGEIRSHLGIATHEGGDLETARVHYEKALEIFRGHADLRREGRALGSLAVLHNERGRFEDAQTHYEWALRLLRRVGDVRSQAIFLCNLGDLHHEQGRLAEARRHYEDATRHLETVGDERVRGVVIGNLGAVLQEQGDLEEALSHRRDAVDILGSAGDRRLAAVFQGYAGEVLHERGDLHEANLAYGEALDALEGLGDRRYEALFLAQRGTVSAERGQMGLAQADWDRAEALERGLDDGLLRRALVTHRAHEAVARGDLGAARSALQEARTDAASSDAVRFAIRRLSAALGRAGDDATTTAGDVQPLRIAEDGRGFQVPGPDEAEVDLSRRRSLRLIVAKLGDQREAARGHGLSLDDLLEAGWPGEKVQPEAGANRVYVALATLRKMGLREVLLSRDDGYLLDPEVPLERY